MPGCDVRHLEAHLPVEAGAILLGDALEVGHEHPALDLPMGALHAGVQQVNLHQVAFIYQGSSRGERQPAPRSARATWDAPETQLQTRSTMGQGYIPIPSRSGEGTGSPTLPRTPVVLPRLPSAYWEGCRCPSWAAAAQSCPSSKGCSGQRRKSPPRRTPRAAASAPAGTRCSARRGGGKAPVPRRGWGCHPLPPPHQYPPQLLPRHRHSHPRDPSSAPRTVSRTSLLIFTRKAGRRWKTCSSSVRYPRRAARACSRRAVPRTSAWPPPARSTTT